MNIITQFINWLEKLLSDDEEAAELERILRDRDHE
jgi:hypothetical protein